MADKYSVTSERIYFMKSKHKGILYIIGAAFCFSLMTVCVRASGDLPTMEKVLFRNLVAAFVSWGILFKNKTPIKIAKGDWPDLLMRSICGGLGMILNFYAIDRLNISDANLLNKLSPFFSMLMSIWILKEKPSKKEWGILGIAFIGALFVIKPGFNMALIPALAGTLGGFGAGVAYTYVRRLGMRGVPGTIIVMFFSTFTTIFCFPFFLASFVPMTWIQLACLLGAGVAATGGQLCITAAYTHAPAKEISVYDYTQVVFAAVWGFVLWGQVPDIYSIIGYIIIIGVAIYRVL